VNVKHNTPSPNAAAINNNTNIIISRDPIFFTKQKTKFMSVKSKKTTTRKKRSTANPNPTKCGIKKARM
jgi:hypothetical protein